MSPNNIGGGGVEEMVIKPKPVGVGKKDTSGPNSLRRIRMELPGQEKIAIAIKIIRDMDRARKKRYM